MIKKDTFNPEIHNRKSIRIHNYDYSQVGMYFVTICCQDMVCRFGSVVDGNMVLNECGEVAQKCWEDIAKRFLNIELHSYIVMPNHFHGIIEIKEIVGAGLTPALNDKIRATARVAPTINKEDNPKLSDIIGAYKSIVTRSCLKLFKEKNLFLGKLWQRNYYEHVIRNEHSYNEITKYIFTNPQKWEIDKFYHL